MLGVAVPSTFEGKPVTAAFARVVASGR